MKVKKTPGGTPGLTDRQKGQLRGMILGKDPRQFQFDFALWTRAIVRDLIAAKFGVTSNVQQVGNILREMGLAS